MGLLELGGGQVAEANVQPSVAYSTSWTLR